jgi:hypothetical protein
MVLAIDFNILNRSQSKILFVIAMFKHKKDMKTINNIFVCVLCIHIPVCEEI